MPDVLAEKAWSSQFDEDLAHQKALKWLPWVGGNFESLSVRTMLLGESVYDWSPGTDACRNRYAHPNGLRITHTNHALNFERDSAYVRNIERAIFQEASPSKEKKLSLWKSVAYHNLVLDLLPSKKHRPSSEQYVAGWRALFPLCQKLGVQQCVVYGLERPKRRALNDVLVDNKADFFWRKIAVPKSKSNAHVLQCVLPCGQTLKLIFIRHPSAFFSWRNWSSVLAQELKIWPNAT